MIGYLGLLYAATLLKDDGRDELLLKALCPSFHPKAHGESQAQKTEAGC